MNHDALVQARTLPTATRLGTHWTQKELDALKQMKESGVPDRIAADALHRSLYGVRGTKRNLTERLERKVATRRPVLPYDQGFTSLEAMGF